MTTTPHRRGWHDGKLEDLVFFQRGYDITQAQQRPGQYPVISSSGVTSYHNEFKASGPGVVIGRKGTLGSIHFTQGDYWPHDTTLWSKDFRGNNPRFVFYFLHTLNLKRFDIGNSNPTLNRNHIHDLQIRIPSNMVQDGIASILSAYDDLIENNRRRMAKLEEAARLLYQEWFVRLRFPGHERTRIVNGVPEGWRRGILQELTVYVSRGITPIYDENGPSIVINQKCIRDGMINLGFSRRQSREIPPAKVVRRGDVLINSTGEGTLGRVAQIKVPLENCTVDTHITIVRPNELAGIHFLGNTLVGLQSVLSSMGRGATNQTELSRDSISQLSLLIPAKTVCEQFDVFADPIWEQISNLAAQSEKLRAARDLLLPRLMSGEIAV